MYFILYFVKIITGEFLRPDAHAPHDAPRLPLPAGARDLTAPHLRALRCCPSHYLEQAAVGPETRARGKELVIWPLEVKEMEEKLIWICIDSLEM